MKNGNNKETASAFVNYQSCKGSNLTSYGSDIWSYQTKIATHENGVILLTKKDYSVTTQKHKAHIISAAAAANVALFEVPYIEPDEKQTGQNFEYLLSIAKDFADRAKRARKPINKSFYNVQSISAKIKAYKYESIFMNE